MKVREKFTGAEVCHLSIILLTETLRGPTSAERLSCLQRARAIKFLISPDQIVLRDSAG